eukprot:14748898-Heterocapsa_arctica.AAC.1
MLLLYRTCKNGYATSVGLGWRLTGSLDCPPSWTFLLVLVSWRIPASTTMSLTSEIVAGDW